MTGVWEAEVALPRGTSPRSCACGCRTGTARSRARCAAPRSRRPWCAVTGTLADKEVELVGVGSRGSIQVRGALEEEKLAGKVTLGGEEYELEAERTSREYEIAGRPELRKAKEEEPTEVKGKPKSPGIDAKLEPLRPRMRGEKAVVVEVDREDEILECVEAFEDAGIKPVLFGAQDAWRVADEIRGRVAGVLLGQVRCAGIRARGSRAGRTATPSSPAPGSRSRSTATPRRAPASSGCSRPTASPRACAPTVALRALTSDAAAMLGDRRPRRHARAGSRRRRAAARRAAARAVDERPARLGRRPRGAMSLALLHAAWLLLALGAPAREAPARDPLGERVPGASRGAGWPGPRDPRGQDPDLRARRAAPSSTTASCSSARGASSSSARAAETAIPAGYEVLDAGERWLVPGFIDLHCHVAGPELFQGKNDINDMVYLANPGLRGRAVGDPGQRRPAPRRRRRRDDRALHPGLGHEHGRAGRAAEDGLRALRGGELRDPGLAQARAGRQPRALGRSASAARS